MGNIDKQEAEFWFDESVDEINREIQTQQANTKILAQQQEVHYQTVSTKKRQNHV